MSKLGYGPERSVGVMAVCKIIPRIPTSVSWTLRSLNPPRRRVMVAKVGMNAVAGDMVGGVGVRKRCLRAAARNAGSGDRT